MKYANERHGAMSLQWLRRAGAGASSPVFYILYFVFSISCFISCSSGVEDPTPAAKSSFQVLPGATPYYEVEDSRVLTRDGATVWAPPTDPIEYKLYSELNGKFIAQQSLVNRNIGIFFTQGTDASLTGQFVYLAGIHYTQAEVDEHNATLTGLLNSTDALTAEQAEAYNSAMSPATDKVAGDVLSAEEAAAYNATKGAWTTSDWKRQEEWWTSVDLESSPFGTYYLYGYIPNLSSVSSSLSVLSGEGKTYADGAVLTLSGVPTVTANDVCVVIGAKKGRSKTDDTFGTSTQRITRGQFNYEYANKDNNHIFLLLDHIYSSIRFRFKVDPKYASLRTIKLRELKLTPVNGSGTPLKDKTNIVITLEANPDGNDPIKSITYSSTAGYNDTDESIFRSNTGVKLKTTYDEYLGSFAPRNIDKFVLTSIYDVYDNNTSVPYLDGNLIRQDTAQNALTLTSPMERGYMYTIDLSVEPTYLYRLSEPDLDNPTVRVTP